MTDNYFNNPLKGVELAEQVTNPNIIVGRYSYYSGYYHGHSFDECARYLMDDRNDVDKLIIGSFCSIGSGVVFMMAGNQGHRMEWISSFPFFYDPRAEFEGAVDGYQPKGDTVIGNDVWIGTEVIIMPGVKIGHGAVIGSRSVVTNDVAPYTIVAGNPAKPLRQRFTAKDIERLLEITWWDWPMEKLTPAIPLMCSENIDALYQYWTLQVSSIDI